MTSVQRVQANTLPFVSENVLPKNAPMPLMSRTGPADRSSSLNNQGKGKKLVSQVSSRNYSDYCHFKLSMGIIINYYFSRIKCISV